MNCPSLLVLSVLEHIDHLLQPSTSLAFYPLVGLKSYCLRDLMGENNLTTLSGPKRHLGHTSLSRSLLVVLADG